MNKACWLIALMLAATLGSVSHAAPERAGDFALLDQAGNFHQFSRYRHKDAIVVFAQANACADQAATINSLRDLRSKWEENVAFLMINSAGDDLSAIRDYAEQQGLDFPILVDSSQLVAQTLKISKAGEVLVLDPERLAVLYRGPLHDHLEMTLTNTTAGTVTDTMVMPASGCDLDIPEAATVAGDVPDYATEVAPLIAENCASCHREGGIGPFAMNSHLMLQGWSPMIREVLLTKRMPPMQVDNSIGHFENAAYIADADLRTLVSWIDAGAPRGNTAVDPLTQIEHADLRAWQLGEPDYIIKTPRQEIPATGVLDYIDVDVDLPFTEDKWVKAVQFIPGAPDVLHHLLTYVTAPNENFEGGEADQRSIARRFLEGYAPGKVEAMTFPEDTGVFIPAGHKLSMQLHFTTNGRATSDETLLGLYMYDEKPRYENLTRSVSGRFRIPPYAIDHKATAQYVFNEDVYVNGLRAHMHFRGKDMKFSVEYPDGSMEDLLSVPNYSYAWQPTYQLSEHKFLPAGTKVHVTGAFDNSEFNPANPDPSKEITFGLQSWDEMFIGYWTYYQAGE
ncbi:MAG: redoxin domain-containing protein [Pseudomonadales bacterium]|nr:redoxin domain-containing protein [Pseudomonadales bacterium]